METFSAEGAFAKSDSIHPIVFPADVLIEAAFHTGPLSWLRPGIQRQRGSTTTRQRETEYYAGSNEPISIWFSSAGDFGIHDGVPANARRLSGSTTPSTKMDGRFLRKSADTRAHTSLRLHAKRTTLGCSGLGLRIVRYKTPDRSRAAASRVDHARDSGTRSDMGTPRSRRCLPRKGIVDSSDIPAWLAAVSGLTDPKEIDQFWRELVDSRTAMGELEKSGVSVKELRDRIADIEKLREKGIDPEKAFRDADVVGAINSAMTKPGQPPASTPAILEAIERGRSGPGPSGHQWPPIITLQFGIKRYGDCIG